MAASPNTDNYVLGKGVIYFDQLINSVYQGELDLGNAPTFTTNISIEERDHFSSRSGLKAKDKVIVSQLTPSFTFTLDEINKENLALLNLADIKEVNQSLGAAEKEVVTAYVGKRSKLAHRSVSCWTLPYDGGTVIFVLGETVTGAGGAAGVVVSITGDSTSGTLVLARTNATAFVDDEAITGSGSGAAVVNSATGGTIVATNPTILVQDSADAVTYVAGTDYTILSSSKDDKVGRIKVLDGGSITDKETLHITYGYLKYDYYEIQAFKNTQIVGRLRFVSDNAAGEDLEIEAWNVSLTSSGDTPFIGDDWSTLAFSVKVLKDETGHPDSPYMNIYVE